MFDNIEFKYTLLEKIRNKYWSIVPYKYRPSELWYQLKCFCWFRYTTVKPRTLPYHSWVDLDHLLYHCSFDILIGFIDKECSPGHIDWESSGHTVMVDGQQVNVRVEMQRIYDWWKDFHVYKDVTNILFEQSNLHPATDDSKRLDDGCIEWKQKFETPEDEYIYHKVMKATINLETICNNEINNMLHRLINIRQYMWT